jgi:hypothetical protein
VKSSGTSVRKGKRGPKCDRAMVSATTASSSSGEAAKGLPTTSTGMPPLPAT